MKAIVRRAPRMVGHVLLSIGACLGVLVLLGSIATPLLGVRPVVITSGSMEPAIPTGSLTLTHEIPASDAAVGDVVMVTAASGSRVTHRVISTSRSGDQVALELQGDANEVPDPETYVVSRVDRVVLDVPWVGYLFSALRTPVGLFGLGVLTTVLVVLIVSGGARGPKSGQDERDRVDRPAGRRRRSARPVSRGGVTALAVCAATSLAAGSTVSSQAAWVDPVSLTGSTLAAYNVPKPAITSCTVTGLTQKTATIVWTEVSSPYAINYTATIVETGQSMTVTDNGSTRQTQFSAGLLSTVLNQTYNIRITAALPAPGSSWTKTSNQPVTIGLLGLSLSCGTAT
jgi:signal peptidase I